ncbi:NADH-quinone oxidoreductase subunit N [Blochmannia endosymbiont of Colobopsis nipponica]|uniref:NADH-quinone oxidoreductase subunit N n=1 Tax=Blochmannia endosymbiont of Colobopsis nipponica TaxID=2681987 RepID=UPI00177D250F|nr:NADH-quinone oxidoreductase subunit N [Blochmannia endosymbiont of Colobopsis nipponica]QOI10984.1 NADH-quinone oxidoreductase subunit N [Blochmannia endosymbiont of Colobopsis nipponica]
MLITFQQIFALLPLLIIGASILFVLLCIIFIRNHFIISTTVVVGLLLSLFSLYFVYQNGTQVVTELLIVDSSSIFYSILILLAGLSSVILAYPACLNTYSGNREEFYLLVLISVMGGILLSCANHLVMIFLGIELMSIPLYGLIGYTYRDNISFLGVSIKYTLLSTVSSSFLLFGIALMYVCFGKLSIVDIKNCINENSVIFPELFMLGLGFMITSFGFKLSLVPFHSWTPDVYQGTSIPVSLFLATVSKISVFAVMMRIFFPSFLFYDEKINLVLIFIFCISMLVGSISATRQNCIRKILGYSSIAHLSSILLGLLTGQNSEFSLETIGISLISYLLGTVGVFSILSLVSPGMNGKSNDSLFLYRGLFLNNPFLSFVFTVLLLNLSGFPITLGFISKFYLIVLGITSQLWWFIGVFITSSIISFFYYLRIIINLYSFSSSKLLCNVPFYWGITPSGLIIIISFILLAFLGIYPKPLINFVQILYNYY